MSVVRTRPQSRPSLRRLAAIAAAAIVLPATLSACGADEIGERAVEKAAEDALKSDGVDVDINDGEVKIENSDGSYVSGRDLPDDFPKDDVPLIGDVQAGATSTVDGKKGWTVTTRVDDDSESAFAAAGDKLEDAGFKSQGEAYGTYAGFESDSHQVIVSATDDQQGGAIVSYIVSADK